MPVILGLSVTFQVLRSTWFAKWAALTQVCKPSFGRLMLVIIFKISLQFSVVFPPAVFLVGKKIICLKHLVHVSTATWSQNGIQILFKIIPILRTRMSCKNLMSCDCGSLSLSLSLFIISVLYSCARSSGFCEHWHQLTGFWSLIYVYSSSLSTKWNLFIF